MIRRPLLASVTLLSAWACAAKALSPPTIHWFQADPSTIASTASTTLRWMVDGATTVSIDSGIGTVSAAGSTTVSPPATTIYTLTATNGAGSSVKAIVVVVGPNPTRDVLRAVHMVTPINGQHFTAPAALRVFASATNGFVYDGCGADGSGASCADRVDFYVDNSVLAQVPKTQSEYSVFKAAFSGIAAGAHRVWARGIYNDPRGPTQNLDSESVWIVVDPPPAYAQTINLAQDVSLSGSQSYALVGSAGGRIRLNGNGHRIVSTASWTGQLTLDHVDLFGLGHFDDPTPGIEVSTSGSIRLENDVIDSSGTVTLTLRNLATAIIRGNEFRSNMLMPEAQLPDYGPNRSYPALDLAGDSTAVKTLQGNRFGLGWVNLYNVDNWLIGGTTDAEGNVLIGARVGISAQNSSRVVIRRNLSYHIYYGGWSQGNNFELSGSNDILVEHNLIGGGSWPIRGLGGELRGNLVLDAGHQWLWITDDGAQAHHNVFVGGDGDVAGIWLIYQPQNVRVFNNTLDGLGSSSFIKPVLFGSDSGQLSSGMLRSNALVGFPDPPMVQTDGTADADFNLFFGAQGTPQNYSDGRHPAHDVGGPNAQVDPKFSQPADLLRFDWGDLWSRTLSVRQILEDYRARYKPAVASPLLGAGDPTTVAGNNVGAIGNGEPGDIFGRLPLGLFGDDFELGNTLAWSSTVP